MSPLTATSTPFLGCIADDVTGATDLAINLVQGGMHVVQWLEMPTPQDIAEQRADAAVVALKTRSCPAAAAVASSLGALDVLRSSGCRRYFFKYCSTFDSTDRGNIGPVTEALVDSLGISHTVFCPAYPGNGRTLYRGHLFVHEQLLSESGMAHHPLTPMGDPNIVRVLERQTVRPVGLVGYAAVAQGADAVRAAMRGLLSAGKVHLLADCCDDQHLQTLAAAWWDLPMVTGGSAIAGYLPDAWREHRLLAADTHRVSLPTIAGRSLILSGSCSPATNLQVAAARKHCATWQVDVARVLANAGAECRQVVDWAVASDPSLPLLVYSTSSADQVLALQKRFGREVVARGLENFHGQIARALVDTIGVRQIVVAGGETAGAVTAALNIRALRIGPQICPGVPWTEPIGGVQLALALKSGNFGGENFFQASLEMLR